MSCDHRKTTERILEADMDTASVSWCQECGALKVGIEPWMLPRGPMNLTRMDGPEYVIQNGSITCLRCGRISHNPNDVANHYCGHCHVFLPSTSGG